MPTQVMMDFISWLYLLVLVAPIVGLIMGCCSECAIHVDDFSTARTGTDYTSLFGGGTWTVSGGTVSTGSANARILATAANANSRGHVVVSVKTSTAGG